MSAAVSIYIYDHTPSSQSRLYKQRKSSLHGTVSYVVFQNIQGYDVLLLYTMDRFYSPDLCLSTCKEFIVRYNIICCVSKHSCYYYLYCFCRLVFPLPTFVRTRNSLDVRCMENHIKTSMSRLEKMVLYMLKLVLS